MPITVKRELLIPAAGNATAEIRTHHYLDAEGLRRRETRKFESQADTTDYYEYRDSDDNGRTWGEWIREKPLTKEPVGNDEIDENLGYPNAQHVWNPVYRHYVSLETQFLYVDGYEQTMARYWRGECYCAHNFLAVEETDGTKHPRMLIRYEEGADYNRSNYHETDYLHTNIARGSELMVLKNGDILFDMELPMHVACRMAGVDRNAVFPSAPGNGHAWALLIGRGKWNPERKQYAVTFAAPIIMDDRINSRGTSEPGFAELASGRILVVYRVSCVRRENWNCRVSPYLPNCKYYTYSDDGGKTFAPPMPWHYDTREFLYSSATFSRFFRSRKNGKLYWIGNITDPTKTEGNYPRYPLQIAEVDEEWGVVKKDTVTVIDTRREGETELVQLSNFALIENRETDDIELYLCKFGQYEGNHIFDCETWKYTITLPDKT